MQSTTSKLAILLVVAAGVVLACMVFGARPTPDDEEMPGRRSVAASTDAASAQQLARAMADLQASIDRLNATLAGRRAAGEEGEAGSEPLERVPVEPFSSADLMAKLDALIEAVKASSLSASGGVDLRQVFERRPVTPGTLLKSTWTSEQSARTDLLMMSYAQVLERLGPPLDMESRHDGTVFWHYADGVATFVDRRACNVVIRN